MNVEELKISERIIILEQKENAPSRFKIKSYKQKIKFMEEKKIPQRDIKDVVQHFFLENKSVPQKTKDSIPKIIYFSQERIIMLVTTEGKEIIWKRQEFVKSYGWFFFVIDSEEDLANKKAGKKREKIPQKKEETISVQEYTFEDKKIPLKQKINMRSLYRTKEYHQYFSMIRKKKIPQMPIQEVLDDFFKKNQAIPLKEKKAIGKLIYYLEERVIVVKSLIGDKMYKDLKKLVSKYGWYFYITGVPVGPSEISIAIDKVEKRYDISFIEKMSLTQSLEPNESIKVYLYPVSLKPNHNCHILRIGDVNIVLDCGIFEEDFENINEFFSLISQQNDSPPAEESDREKLKQIDNSLNFDKDETLVRNENEGKDTDDSNFHNPPQSEIGDNSKLKIDAIFVSHSHFDHLNGLKKLIELYPDVPILCSRITLDLYLLRDSDFLKQEAREAIEEEIYLKIIRNVIYVENGTIIKFPNKKCYISFYHAGHMPGALMFMAKIKDFRFLYTGDYTYWDYPPFAGTRKFLEQISRPIDFLLIDSTSAYEEFDNMADQISSLMLFLEQKAEYEDNCLIGADPSSLAITFMLTIWRYFRKMQLRRNYQKRPNIYVDMMVRKNIQVINHRYEYIYGPISKLIRDKANPFNSIKFRWFDYSDLEFLRKKNNIIISHPPDLSYGIIRNAVNIIGRNPHNMVYLAGAIHEEPGESLVYPQENDNSAVDINIKHKNDEIPVEKEAENDIENEVNNELQLKDEVIEPSFDAETQESSEIRIKIEENTEIINESIDIPTDQTPEFIPYVARDGKESMPEIYFTEDWRVPFRAMLLNHFIPSLKIKLHGDKKQLFEMIKVLEPKEVSFFHQNPRKLVDLASEVEESGVKKVSISQERKLILLHD